MAFWTEARRCRCVFPGWLHESVYSQENTGVAVNHHLPKVGKSGILIVVYSILMASSVVAVSTLAVPGPLIKLQTVDCSS